MNLSTLKKHLSDRVYLASIILMLVVTLIVLAISAVNIQPGELRIPVRYSWFDERNYVLDQWYYLLSFPIFVVTVAVLHTLLSAKLYQMKGRLFALSTVGLGIIILIFALVVFVSIFRVVSLS